MSRITGTWERMLTVWTTEEGAAAGTASSEEEVEERGEAMEQGQAEAGRAIGSQEVKPVTNTM